MAFADFFGRDPLELWLLAGLAVVMVAALLRLAWRRRLLRGRGGDPDPLLVFPGDTVRRPMTPAPIGGLAWAPPADEVDEEEMTYRATSHIAPLPPVHPSNPSHPVHPSHPAPSQPTIRPALPHGPAPLAAAATWQPPSADRQYPAPLPPRPRERSWSSRPLVPVPAPVAVDEASETIRLPTASDGTVQLLPGMLVMTEGPEIGREYRFLRVGSQPVPELTMGRVSGPPYRHIHLPAATVSRLHARIRYEGGCWQIANLSSTNPVRLNGRELPTTADFLLTDGDRIQLGEVELCYRDGR